MKLTSDFVFGFIVLIHFLADFGLQTHDQAIKKSEGDNPLNLALFQHVSVYSLTWFFAVLAISQRPDISFCFALITFLTHYWTDYTTSRINKKFFSVQNYHDGFVGVGYDQVLHMFQLWYTFKYLNLL